VNPTSPGDLGVTLTVQVLLLLLSQGGSKEGRGAGGGEVCIWLTL
jgi:hypothetical protein